MLNTITYYNQQADNFFERTVDKDMSGIYELFLPLVPERGRILDAGCGSGRDAKAFKDLGYSVVAMDASFELVKRSSVFISQPTLHLNFEDIKFDAEFDAIWANASLLHVPSNALLSILNKLHSALKTGGILYMSFKYGRKDYVKGERFFNDQNEDSINSYLQQIPGLQLIQNLKTKDTRGQSHSLDFWLNCFVRKTQQTGNN